MIMQTDLYVWSYASIDASHSETLADGRRMAQEPDYKAIIPNANQRRRMSRIIRMGVASALKCCSGIDTQRISAIVSATGLGCLADTERFMESICAYGEEMLNPTTFIQSTFNTIAGQLALLLQAKGDNMTYSHRYHSLETALVDASLYLAEGGDLILLNAFDELTDTAYRLQHRLGLLSSGVVLGEGAHAFVLGRATQGAYARIACLDYFVGESSASALHERIIAMLATQSLEPTDLGLWLQGSNGTPALAHLYASLIALEPSLGACAFPFKKLSGEYHTASAYALVYALEALEQGVVSSPILIHNSRDGSAHSLILILPC